MEVIDGVFRKNLVKSAAGTPYTPIFVERIYIPKQPASKSKMFDGLKFPCWLTMTINPDRQSSTKYATQVYVTNDQHRPPFTIGIGQLNSILQGLKWEENLYIENPHEKDVDF